MLIRRAPIAPSDLGHALGREHLVGGPARRPAVLDPDDDAARARAASRSWWRDEHHREAALAVERAIDVHDRGRRPGIDAGGRLVEEEDLRLGRERARDQHALLLAAGERPERLLGDGVQADLLEALGGEAPLARGRRAEAAAAARTCP